MKYAILVLGMLVSPAQAAFNKYECENIRAYYTPCAEPPLCTES